MLAKLIRYEIGERKDFSFFVPERRALKIRRGGENGFKIDLVVMGKKTLVQNGRGFSPNLYLINGSIFYGKYAKKSQI